MMARLLGLNARKQGLHLQCFSYYCYQHESEQGGMLPNIFFIHSRLAPKALLYVRFADVSNLIQK